MKDKRKYLTIPYVIWLIAFTAIPLLLVVFYGLTDQSGHPTLANLFAIAAPEHRKALLLSTLLSLASTLICLALAYPLAMILRGLRVGRGRLVVFLFVLPMWMNFLLRTMAWQTILEKQGVLNGLLRLLRLPDVEIINTPYAIVLGMVYNFLPFMILPIYNSLMKIGDDVLDAARDLGAGSLQVFLRVIAPLSVPGVISGVTMVFVPALTTFVISNLLGGGKILLIGNVIEQEFSFSMNWHLGSGLSLVLMAFLLASMALFAKYDKDGEGAMLG